MNIKTKLEVLRRINRIYDDFLSGYDLACCCACAHCCTRNVIMTTLEGYRIIQYVQSSGKSDLVEKLKAVAGEPRFIPAVSLNQLADMGYAGKEIPEEELVETDMQCPALETDVCPIYEVRPFACRSLVSTQNCAEKEAAEIEPFVVTVNNVVMQFIEHIDESGCTGNFTDVLLCLEKADVLATYESNGGISHCPGLISNHPLRVLLVPPEHQEQIKPVLKKLQQIQVPK